MSVRLLPKLLARLGIGLLLGLLLLVGPDTAVLAQANTDPAIEPLQPGQVQTFAGIDFVFIPPGSFDMGSNGTDPGEQPIQRVTISKGFWMGRYELTQEQWQAVMGANPAYFKGGSQLPVEMVSCNDIQAFLLKINEKYPGMGFRLPTEAEWEYACRAGTTTSYFFGNDPALLGDYAWFANNAGGSPHPVGQKKPNPWGLYDMSGNVWESVQDFYGLYSGHAQVDPTGPPNGECKIRRGGGWCFSPDECRSARRLLHCLAFANNALGFRLVKPM